MSALILLLLAVCLALLILEDRQVRRDRSELVHVVYVNGIRGKSTVTRMIDGGLRAGGWKVFCKTTGTVPMVIGVDGTARPLVRRGRANISEQVRVLHRAVREGAQILVIECMAVDPALQRGGVASALLTYAEDWARARGIPVFHADTYCKNRKMQALFRKRGFVQRGEIHLPGRSLPFPAFEKLL